MIKHSIDGWILEEYDWVPETGVATLLYEKFDAETKKVLTETVVLQQPQHPEHAGWSYVNQMLRQRTLELGRLPKHVDDDYSWDD